MKKLVLYLGLVVPLLGLHGCATGIKGTANEITAETINPRPGYGVVFGRICEGNGLFFKGADEKSEPILHKGGKTLFALQLQEGDYHLFKMGAATGVMVTDEPFRFKVKAGEVRYVGSLLPRFQSNGISRFPGACQAEEARVVKTVKWKLSTSMRTSDPVWGIDLANSPSGAIRDLKVVYPALDASKVQISIME